MSAAEPEENQITAAIVIKPQKGTVIYTKSFKIPESYTKVYAKRQFKSTIDYTIFTEDHLRNLLVQRHSY